LEAGLCPDPLRNLHVTAFPQIPQFDFRGGDEEGNENVGKKRRGEGRKGDS